MGFGSWVGRLFSSSPETSDKKAPATDAKPAVVAADGVVPDGEIVQELRTYFAGKARKKLAPEAIEVDANLFDAGYSDSLSFVDFLLHIEKRYGVALNEFELTANPHLNNINSIAARVTATRAAS